MGGSWHPGSLQDGSKKTVGTVQMGNGLKIPVTKHARRQAEPPLRHYGLCGQMDEIRVIRQKGGHDGLILGMEQAARGIDQPSFRGHQIGS